ncbi:MAG: FlgO family outer membrane protein [Hydrogenophilus sp.]|nr:FlgO family outer membrane protein [Hydrogenophilus sp.]
MYSPYPPRPNCLRRWKTPCFPLTPSGPLPSSLLSSALLLLLSLLSTACVTLPTEIHLFRTPCDDACAPCIEEEMKRVADQLCVRQGIAQALPVIIPDFVAVDDFRSRTLGKRLAEEFRLAWQKSCPNPIRILELGAHYRLDDDGLKLLTRDLAHLMRDTIDDPTLLVGTYRLEERAVRYFIRRVHLPTQTATAMAAGRAPRHCLDPTFKLPRTLLE